jgi:hypothetical protein
MAGGRRAGVPVLAVGAVLAFAAPSALLTCVLLLPTLMAWVGDRTSRKLATRAVLLFGVAAAYPTLDVLWHTGHRLPDAISLATDIPTLAWCWAVQAGAWLLGQVIPIMFTTLMHRQVERREHALERRRQALETEWQ